MHSLINPSIAIKTASEVHVFASFWRRDQAFVLLQRAWATFHDQADAPQRLTRTRTRTRTRARTRARARTRTRTRTRTLL